MNVGNDLVVKDINDIIKEIDNNDRELCDDIITNLEKTAVEQIKLGKVIKIPYIGNYSYNRLYLNLKEHHKELKDLRKKVDINTYKSKVRELVSDTKKKLNDDIKSELRWNKFKLKHKKKFYALATLHGVSYAKVWLYFHGVASVVPFDKDVQYMFDKLNETN